MRYEIEIVCNELRPSVPLNMSVLGQRPLPLTNPKELLRIEISPVVYTANDLVVARARRLSRLPLYRHSKKPPNTPRFHDTPWTADSSPVTPFGNPAGMALMTKGQALAPVPTSISLTLPPLQEAALTSVISPNLVPAAIVAAAKNLPLSVTLHVIVAPPSNVRAPSDGALIDPAGAIHSGCRCRTSGTDGREQSEPDDRDVPDTPVHG